MLIYLQQVLILSKEKNLIIQYKPQSHFKKQEMQKIP